MIDPKRGAPHPVPSTMTLTVNADAHLVLLEFAPGTTLTGAHGAALVEALERVVGVDGAPFGLLADAKGVAGTDGDYRATTGSFFEPHRHAARIALLNLGPIIRVVAEMFRVGIGLQLKTFDDEAAARAWLRAQGIHA